VHVFDCAKKIKQTPQKKGKSFPEEKKSQIKFMGYLGYPIFMNQRYYKLKNPLI
jgi:hypothetical protein